MANQAISSFLSFDDEVKNVLVIGPANGAISYAPIVSSYLQKYFRTIKFRHGRTQLDKNDKHYIAEKHKALIDISDTFIIVEDIVNQGTTIKEVSAILPKQVNSVLCLVDRGNNSAENLGIEQFFPFLRVNMDQYDPRKNASLFESEMKINTTLGKGNIWVEQFGQPPYGDDVDFSTFSLLK
ncbi:MAG: phosphoribosyltransferase family protein [Candidatus Gracilibacteria bacterium]|nr:phosphoribosyltransferase family protein [Candidatus Gracilibacteria bacterium]